MSARSMVECFGVIFWRGHETSRKTRPPNFIGDAHRADHDVLVEKLSHARIYMREQSRALPRILPALPQLIQKQEIAPMSRMLRVV